MEANELRIGNWVFCNKSYVNKPVRVTGISVVDRRDDHTGIYEAFIYLNEHDLLKDTEFNDTFINYKQGVMTLEQISGIPLTEEWLVKFGFTKHSTNWEETSGTENMVGYRIECNEWDKSGIFVSKRLEVFISVIWSDFERLQTTQLKYIHQLENLFFILAGKELEYNG